MSEKKTNLDEHINKLRYKMNYIINESMSYKQLSEEDFAGDDELPTQFNKPADNPLDKSQNANELPPANELPQSGSTEQIQPAASQDLQQTDSALQQNQSVDKIQNDIIRQNISAMTKIHSKLEELESYVQNLNQEYSKLSAAVEEVREPTTSEKLMSKKEVSYPYYFNLNDVWKGNWFEQSRENANEKGIKELPDGTFIADFDDLPQYSKTDITNSFNKLT